MARSSFSDVSVDAVAAYWNARPCNIRHSDKPIGTREYFDEVEARKYRVEPHIPRFADFERWHDKDVLEVGCGIGTDTINFLRAGARVTAIDVSAESIRIARQRGTVFGYARNPQLFMGVADIEDPGAVTTDTLARRGPFDLVYSFGVLHHTPNPAKALMQIRKLIKPDGELRLMMYHRYSFKAFQLTRGRVWRDDLVAVQSEAQTGSPVTYTYTPRRLRAMLAHAGFEVTDESVDHIFPYQWKPYAEYRYVRTPLARALSPRAWRWLEHRIGWHLCVKARPV